METLWSSQVEYECNLVSGPLISGQTLTPREPWQSFWKRLLLPASMWNLHSSTGGLPLWPVTALLAMSEGGDNVGPDQN
jgi:hypothetical protein